MRSPSTTIFIMTVILSLHKGIITDINAEAATVQEHEQRLRGFSASDLQRKLKLRTPQGINWMEACPGGSEPANEPCLDEDGNDNCPDDYVCLPNPEGQPLCCPTLDRMELSSEIKKCVNGTEIPDLFCGRGFNRTDCPKGSYCEIHPTDMYAVCCDDTNTTFGTSYPTPSPTSQGTNI
mmetsp:Transcript_16182/g.20159  ORF Transcript_16182/g.20159 Transcript_16182/m.20159 type:complete len:179 (+) Transcript_16182:198-734(+)